MNRKNLITISLLAFWLLTLSWCEFKLQTQGDKPTLWKISADCISYFDGCNTCMITDWVVGWCTRMYCETPANQ